MKHKIGNELDKQKVGDWQQQQKTLNIHTRLPECYVKIAINITKFNNLVHCGSDCKKVEDDQVDLHHPVDLLDILVLFEQVSN
jgi:hypothetical protein